MFITTEPQSVGYGVTAVLPGVAGDLNSVCPAQLSAARGLQQSAADPTRRQSPDLLYRRMELQLRAHDPAVLDSYVAFLRQAARHLNVTVGKL